MGVSISRNPCLRQALANGQRDLVAQPEVALHLGAAQVDVAIFQPHLFVLDGFFRRRKGRQPRVVQDAQFGGLNLDFAGGHLGIDGVRVAQAHLADGGDNVLRPHLLALGVALGSQLLVQHDLAMPVRSRRSRKMRLPWSRRRFTQPISTTSCPASAARNSPQRCVRSRLPKKSSTTRILYSLAGVER